VCKMLFVEFTFVSFLRTRVSCWSDATFNAATLVFVTVRKLTAP